MEGILEMKYIDYSHAHGKELLEVLNKPVLKEIREVLDNLDPYPHGSIKGLSAKEYIADAFVVKGWSKEGRADFNTDKSNFLDLCKWKVAVEMEFSRFEMFFRDFFRFMLMYDKKEIDVGIIITLDEKAFFHWQPYSKPYKSARASFTKLVDILKGDYRSVVKAPIWCIGIE